MNIAEQFSLVQKTVFLTGATGHLGSSIAYGLCQAGARVILNSRSEDNCSDLCRKLTSDGFLAETAVFDITDEHAIADYFMENENLCIDCLINNAYSGRGGTIATANSHEYRQSYEMSVISVHNMFINALPSLRRAVNLCGSANVVNVASMYGVVSPDLSIYASAGVSNPPFYAAAKAALIQWTRYAACEYGRENIRVNSVSPGPFPSFRVQNEAPELIERLSKKVPLGRVGDPKELHGVMVFLASSASTFVNGANIPVDGGWTSW